VYGDVPYVLVKSCAAAYLAQLATARISTGVANVSVVLHKKRERRDMLYRNRFEAGSILATKLAAYARRHDVLVLALPRGGVLVAYQVAMILQVPLDVFVVRKLGVPGREELAMGAIASGGVRVLNTEIVRMLRLPDHIIEAVTKQEQWELERRERRYRDNRPAARVSACTVILVDDGVATGATMRAAVVALRKQGPARLISAVPVAAPATCAALGAEVDEMICAATPDPFYGVGYWYEDFSQITDQQVYDLLAHAEQKRPVARLRP
jgi:putative phosphoribosyl transferase